MVCGLYESKNGNDALCSYSYVTSHSYIDPVPWVLAKDAKGI